MKLTLSHIEEIKSKFEIAHDLLQIDQRLVLTRGLAANARIIDRFGYTYKEVDKLLQLEGAELLTATRDIDIMGPWMPEIEGALRCYFNSHDGRIEKFEEGGCVGWIKGIKIDMLLDCLFYNPTLKTKIVTPFGVPLTVGENAAL